MTSVKARLLAATGMVAVTALACHPAFAAGFYIKEQSVTGLGRSFAGESAMGEDASAIFFNPAALTRLERAEAQVGVHLLIPQADLDNEGSTTTAPDLPSPPLPPGVLTGTRDTTGGSNDPYDPSPVPNAFIAAPLMDGSLWVGLGVTAPFGLANKYDSDWFGRYDSIETDLKTINVAPTVAYRVNERFSIGGGIDVQYADAKLTNAVFTGFASDALSELEGDSWAVGFNIGVMITPVEGTRIGLHYRSAISHELEGKATVTSALGVDQFDASADLDLPSIIAVGIAHELTPRLTLLGEVNWYEWSNFERIQVFADATGEELSNVHQGYENTFSISVGAQYELTDQWTVRGGFQYDETPTTDEFRTTRTPDQDRYWLSAGASYELNDNFVIDAAYTHIFMPDADINVRRPGGGPLAENFPDAVYTDTVASGSSSVDIFALNLRYRF